MKKTFVKILGGATLAVLCLAMFAQLLVSGQDLEKEDAAETAQYFSDNNIEGAWRTIVTQRNCQTGVPIRSFQGVLLFHADGTLSGDSTVMSPALKSASYGVWKHERSWQEYSFTFIFFRFNPDGTLAGSQKVRQTAYLRADGNYFTTNGNLEVLDVNDNVIANGCASSTGARFE